jgi:hypothetical protein
MNERIRELVRQAGLDDADFPIENWDNVPLAKFAKLIVRECAQACINMGNDYEIKSAGQYQAELFAFAIKKHFGVEE